MTTYEWYHGPSPRTVRCFTFQVFTMALRNAGASEGISCPIYNRILVFIRAEAKAGRMQIAITRVPDSWYIPLLRVRHRDDVEDILVVGICLHFEPYGMGTTIPLVNMRFGRTPMGVQAEGLATGCLVPDVFHIAGRGRSILLTTTLAGAQVRDHSTLVISFRSAERALTQTFLHLDTTAANRVRANTPDGTSIRYRVPARPYSTLADCDGPPCNSIQPISYLR